MLGEVGTLTIGLALITSLYVPLAVIWSIRRSDPRWMRSGWNGVYATAALLGLGLLLLLFAFLSDHFEIRYVAQNSTRRLPFYLKVSAIWAGQEGSLLLWSFIQALFLLILVVRLSVKARPLVPWASVILGGVTVFFVGVTLFLSNPFVPLEAVPADGQGLNPLLRHPGMIFHPPTLYLGYVGLAVPFALAMASLITGRVDEWTRIARRWTLVAWLFLGLGLFLGARWAYDVLGWGGYWGWDPVENAGLMPWFTATALLHGAVMQEERKGFRVWNMVMVILSFVLVLFGTFTTRSGLIQSVHAFGRSLLGHYFLAFIGLTLVGSFALVFRHRSLLRGNSSSEGLFSREGAFLITLVLFITLTVSVFVGSTLPTITDVISHRRFEAGPEWFDRVTGPQFGLMVLVLALCPLLGRSAQALRRLRSRGWPALVGAIIVAGGAALAGFTGWTSLVGFALAGLAGGTAVAEIAWDVVGRSRRKGESLLQALQYQVSHHRRRYGGYLVHFGLVLVVIGIIGTRLHTVETELVLAPGEEGYVGRYVLVFEDLRQEPAADHVRTEARIAAYRDREYLTTLTPRIDAYSHQTVGVPALRSGWREDLYVVLAAYSPTAVTLKVFINPLATFLWLGGLVLLAGGTVAVWPSAKEEVRLPLVEARRRRVRNTAAAVVVLALLIAAGVAMWGPGHGASAQRVGRPLPGQSAPGFTLTLLDGNTISLADLNGRVAVLNFWATACPSCEEELPTMQSIWEEYQGQGVILLGVALQEDESIVRNAADRYGLTYPLALDIGERVSTAYGITGVPETFVIDSKGNVAFVHIGPVTAEELMGELEGLLGE
ncbi:MAG TPA: redoxin domain-containing protein [Anaerolineales bacterium]|nr:redoxin domain-containing protein [Anaerolineales bacterium]